MTDFRKLAFVSLVGLGAASLACSSNSGTSGTGGSPGTGTGGSHTGGTSGTGTGGTGTGTGGTGTGTGGISGAAGAGASNGCTVSDPPGGPVIATFASADGGTASLFGTFTYGDNPPPAITYGADMVNVTDTIQITAKNHYQGFGVFFNGNAAGTECLDAHTYTGIQFDLSGSLMGTGCTMQFSINDSEHADTTVTPTDPKLAGPMGSYAPQVQITSELTSASTPIKVPFAAGATGAPLGGSPATAVDPTKLTGVQWQLSTPVAVDGGATECVWNFNVSNVTFY
jgi:hypothetical protein